MVVIINFVLALILLVIASGIGFLVYIIGEGLFGHNTKHGSKYNYDNYRKDYKPDRHSESASSKSDYWRQTSNDYYGGIYRDETEVYHDALMGDDHCSDWADEMYGKDDW
ncbi:MAG: hypothetical protein K6G52_01375 [Treponemataceae bacterium]|nr:hypothetical protein [Treponemataceae bacterium]